MSSFGDWYEQQNREADNDESTLGSDMLPLFLQNGSIPSDLGWNNFKSNLEAQMPQQILGMNYQQRFKVFCALLCLSGLFFFLGFVVGLPLITVRPQKFALCFTFGSLTFMSSFAILRGPVAHFAGMVDAERLPFTIFYVGSMFMTLYFTFTAHGAKGYVTVMTCSGLQLLALLWYLLAFLPGGAQGMKVLTSAILSLLRPLIVGCTKCFGTLALKLFGSRG